MQQQAEAIIFDTETTGFKEAEIIEAAWLVVDHPASLSFVDGSADCTYLGTFN